MEFRIDFHLDTEVAAGTVLLWFFKSSVTKKVGMTIENLLEQFS